MFDIRPPTRTPEKLEALPRPNPHAIEVEAGPTLDADAERQQRVHKTLMDTLDDEGERQAEERYQMSIDEDYHDHMHWKPEDAAVLLDRGQAPLVFNEGRQTIEWLSGSEKRQRKDWKVLPREPGDAQDADVKTDLLKYTDDINMTQWHHSAAFKKAIIGGLGWIEEGLNPDPEQEIIYAGTEDWRNVLRDSRSRDLLQRDARYLFRKKRLDLDYVHAMVANIAPTKLHLLTTEAYTQGQEATEQEAPWYLGRPLTGASDIGHNWQRASSFDDRSSFMQQNGYYDSGRRLSVDMIEAWYRVPEQVEVFIGGMFGGKIYNKQDPRMRYAKLREGALMRAAVRMRMRIMMCTPTTVFWDGPSPFRHGQFGLTPVYGYRRARDGLAYGIWRGMRDLSDDTNKRRSKALWALSANRVITDEENVNGEQDIESLRTEAARPDGIITKKKGTTLEFAENQLDITGNLEMARENTNIMRSVGGVTGENLGERTNASSGKAILAKQDQGGLTTSDLMDNYLYAKKQAGKLRVSHIEQFWTERKAVRILGEGRPHKWVVVNEFDPQTGEFQNDITQREADFHIDMQDYRSSMAQAAQEQMFELLGQIATFAPQVVLSVLDLVVEGADIRNKQEWVARIRKLNGQRDPSKEPTPQEQAQDTVNAAKQAKAEAVQELLAEAQLKVEQANARKTDADATLKTVQAVLARISSMGGAIESAAIVTQMPHLVEAADAITEAAGLEDKGAAAQGPQPNLASMQPPPQQPALPAPPSEIPQEQPPADPMAAMPDPAMGGEGAPMNP